jgi:hypothetical protein
MKALFLTLITLCATIDAVSAEDAAPPPAAPAEIGADELEKLIGPIALYPDPLLSVLLPAAAYPLEIVQAARFMKDPNNTVQVEQQLWGVNVKVVAKFLTVIQRNRVYQRDFGPKTASAVKGITSYNSDKT